MHDSNHCYIYPFLFFVSLYTNSRSSLLPLLPKLPQDGDGYSRVIDHNAQTPATIKDRPVKTKVRTDPDVFFRPALEPINVGTYANCYIYR